MEREVPKSTVRVAGRDVGFQDLLVFSETAFSLGYPVASLDAESVPDRNRLLNKTVGRLSLVVGEFEIRIVILLSC
jgi:hypothetical protein